MSHQHSNERTAFRRPLRVGRHCVAAFAALVLVSIAVSGWGQYRELCRISESKQYLTGIQDAQSRYFEAHGRYADELGLLDLERPEPTFFAVGPVMPGQTGSLATSWSLTLTRFGDALFNDRYTVTFNERGFDGNRSTIRFR